MAYRLCWNTVKPLEKSPYLFDPFRHVGENHLSLQIDQRMSDEVDMFTDHADASLDFTLPEASA